MPLTIAELRELRQEVQAAGERLHALRDLVTEIYGDQNPAAESFHRALENIKRLQHVLANPVTPDSPHGRYSGQDNDGLWSHGVEFVALDYLADAGGDNSDSEDDSDA